MIPSPLGEAGTNGSAQARPVAEEVVVHVGAFELRVLPPVGAGDLRLDLVHDVAIGGPGLARAEHLGDEEVRQRAAGVALRVGVFEGDLVGLAGRQQGVVAALETLAGVSDAARGEQCLGRRGGGSRGSGATTRARAVATSLSNIPEWQLSKINVTFLVFSARRENNPLSSSALMSNTPSVRLSCGTIVLISPEGDLPDGSFIREPWPL